MSRNWNEINMVDACEILTCGVASTPKYVDEKNGIPFLSAQNVKNGEIILDKYNYISQEYHEHLTKKNKPKKGDILYSRVGAKYGEAAVIEHDFEFSVYVSVTLIRPKPDLFDNYYFKYYLNSPRIKDLAKKSIQSSGVPNLNVNVVREFPIPIPSLLEQKQIVEILDKAFESIEQAKANIEKNIENTKELFQSRLNEIFSQKGEGWEEKTLKEVCTKITDGTHQTPKYFDSGYTFLSSGNVTSGIINWDKIKYIDEKQHLEMQKRVSPQLNDILLAKNGTTGVAAIVDRDIEFDIYVSLALLRASDKLEAKYLLHFVNSPIAKKQFNKRLKGSGVPNLHLQEIREVIVPYPISKKEQLKISNYIELLSMRTKQLEKHYKQKLKNLEELKRSILQKAFSGELLNDS